MEPRRQSRLGELAALFLKLGFVAFGGPAAHIAMMEDEVVARRRWMSRQHFLDLVGATNLIPGPNSTEMTMHVGYERRGWAGLLTAGASFILPAALMTGTLAWLYLRYGTMPQVMPFLAGIKPAILAIILAAVWRLGRTAVKDWRLAVIGVGVAGLVLGGVDEVLMLLAGGVVGAVWMRWSGPAARAAGLGLPLLVVPSISAGAPAAGAAAVGAPLWKVGLLFLKIGAILYGSGYVLVAFLEGDVVRDYGWLSQEVLLDAIAIGQLTPGPVLTTATVVGFLVAGLPGAVVATVAIFLPSFVFVWILNPLIPRLRASPWTAAFLDAVNVTAVGLMAAVLVTLGAASLTGWAAWTIALLAAGAVLFLRLGTPWVVLAAALLGALFHLLGF